MALACCGFSATPFAFSSHFTTSRRAASYMPPTFQTFSITFPSCFTTWLLRP